MAKNQDDGVAVTVTDTERYEDGVPVATSLAPALEDADSKPGQKAATKKGS